MNPFDRIFNRYKNLPAVDLTQGRSIAYSRSSTRRLMELIDANGHGNVHGGVIMRMVDESAAIVAIKHSQRSVVTARVETFNFLAPAFIGDLVTVNCEMNFVGRTSMEVGVDVTTEDLITREIRKIASSYVIYVAIDEKRQPTPVPPLIPTDDDEAAIIKRAQIRRAHRKRIDEEWARAEQEQNSGLH
jgi:acyl-CoA hydrolase